MIDVATHSDERISLTTAVLLVQVENSTGKEDPDPDDDDTDADDDADSIALTTTTINHSRRIHEKT
jgi:hypothetical protein